MSTAKIEAALLLLGDYAATALHPRVTTGTLEAIKDAAAEVEAVKRACRVIGDYGVVHSMRFDESKEDDEVNEAADFLCAIGRPGEAS